MAKCIRCGKSTIVRGHVKLFDAVICTPCFKSLGFKLTDTVAAGAYTYDVIKDGADNLDRNLERKKQAHQKWREDNPDLVALMDIIHEGNEENEDEPDEDEDA